MWASESSDVKSENGIQLVSPQLKQIADVRPTSFPMKMKATYGPYKSNDSWLLLPVTNAFPYKILERMMTVLVILFCTQKAKKALRPLVSSPQPKNQFFTIKPVSDEELSCTEESI